MPVLKYVIDNRRTAGDQHPAGNRQPTNPEALWFDGEFPIIDKRHTRRRDVQVPLDDRNSRRQAELHTLFFDLDTCFLAVRSQRKSPRQ